MKLARVMLRTVKGMYDILATYLLVFILPFALAGFLFHLLFGFGAGALGHPSMAAMWDAVAEWSPIGTVWLRIALFLPLHVFVWWIFRKPVARLWPYVEKSFDQLVAAFHWFTDRVPAIRNIGELVFSVAVTALLIPFVIQPTLVPELTDERAWVERAANLLDGTAVAAIGDSVVGMYRRLYADPVVVGGVTDDDVEEVLEHTEQPDDEAVDDLLQRVPSGQRPLMDRWDPYIARAANGDAEKFAYIKAFMWVESAGRQYAVSRTGCAGLMQFCAPTARSKPFRDVFGTGQIYVCSCRDRRCSIPRDVQRDLESGDPMAIDRHQKDFPCEMTDARFDPDKIIRAGGLYIDDLRESYGGNIYLMYIGYNSGPRVAAAVYRKLAGNSNASLEEIAAHLPTAMEPYYGSGAHARARSLVRTHLPKIERAYRRYLPPDAPLATAPADAETAQNRSVTPTAGDVEPE